MPQLMSRPGNPEWDRFANDAMAPAMDVVLKILGAMENVGNAVPPGLQLGPIPAGAMAGVVGKGARYGKAAMTPLLKPLVAAWQAGEPGAAERLAEVLQPYLKSITRARSLGDASAADDALGRANLRLSSVLAKPPKEPIEDPASYFAQGARHASTDESASTSMLSRDQERLRREIETFKTKYEANVGPHPQYLEQRIQRKFGVSPEEYRRLYAVREETIPLATGTESAAEIRTRVNPAAPTEAEQNFGKVEGFASLNDRQKHVVNAMYGQGLTSKEVGAELGISQNTVRQIMAQAKAKLEKAGMKLPPPVGGGSADEILAPGERFKDIVPELTPSGGLRPGQGFRMGNKEPDPEIIRQLGARQNVGDIQNVNTIDDIHWRQSATPEDLEYLARDYRGYEATNAAKEQAGYASGIEAGDFVPGMPMSSSVLIPMSGGSQEPALGTLRPIMDIKWESWGR